MNFDVVKLAACVRDSFVTIVSLKKVKKFVNVWMFEASVRSSESRKRVVHVDLFVPLKKGCP